ncbi:hypothetical protein L3i22_075920 [Actinoplanes sp. L3-i22]|nr:hypothetical protein L3i22_075920 [Actinoplanes sp. L3-i22]
MPCGRSGTGRVNGALRASKVNLRTSWSGKNGRVTSAEPVTRATRSVADAGAVAAPMADAVAATASHPTAFLMVVLSV